MLERSWTLVPLAGIIVGNLMIVAVVATVFWYRARAKELEIHQDLRIREMEHQRRMKELELEIEKTKALQASERVT